MAGVYRSRHPERTVLYRVMFHHIERFLTGSSSSSIAVSSAISAGRRSRPSRPKGGVDEAGIFHRIPRLDDSRLAAIFCREVLRLLVGKGLLSQEWAARILSWRHSGFSVHSRVRAKTKPEAERVGKYMIRPVLALDRLSFLESEGKVGYRHGAELERMDYLEFIARVTSHIPDKGQVMVR